MSQGLHKRIQIRAMQSADLAQVEALDRVCFNDPWPAGSFVYEFENASNSVLMVAEDAQSDPGREIIGAVVIWLVVDEAHVGTIALLPAYRGQKIGLRLLSAALAEAARRGAVRSLLEVRASNLAALHLYFGLGFETVGLRPHYYQDTHEDALLLTLEGLDQKQLFQLSR